MECKHMQQSRYSHSSSIWTIGLCTIPFNIWNAQVQTYKVIQNDMTPVQTPIDSKIPKFETFGLVMFIIIIYVLVIDHSRLTAEQLCHQQAYAIQSASQFCTYSRYGSEIFV